MTAFWQDIQAILFKDVFFLKRLQEWLLDRGPDILLAIITFIIGRYIIRWIRTFVEHVMTRANYDKAAMSFVSQMVYYLLIVGLILVCVNQMGIPTTSFIAAFGAFGIAIGLALQNNISNLASGLLILMFKPFKAGDWIAVGPIEGHVRRIQFMNTSIATKENKLVFVPNSMLTSQTVTNYSYLGERVIAFTFDIRYSNDHHKAIALIKKILEKNPKVLNAKNLEIGIRSFGEDSVQIGAFPRVKANNYWSVYYHTMSAVKDTFDANGIDIPFPQRVVYMHTVKDDESVVTRDMPDAVTIDEAEIKESEAERSHMKFTETFNTSDIDNREADLAADDTLSFKTKPLVSAKQLIQAKIKGRKLLRNKNNKTKE